MGLLILPQSKSCEISPDSSDFNSSRLCSLCGTGGRRISNNESKLVNLLFEGQSIVNTNVLTPYGIFHRAVRIIKHISTRHSGQTSIDQHAYGGDIVTVMFKAQQKCATSQLLLFRQTNTYVTVLQNIQAAGACSYPDASFLGLACKSSLSSTAYNDHCPTLANHRETDLQDTFCISQTTRLDMSHANYTPTLFTTPWRTGC